VTRQATRALTVLARSQAEIDFQTKITDLCDLLGLKWHHETDSRKSKRGFPDLVIAGNEVIFAELKRETGKVTTDQQQWYDRLRAAGANVFVWRPSDWAEVEAVLLRLAGRRRG
jgi:hypothetical protein